MCAQAGQQHRSQLQIAPGLATRQLQQLGEALWGSYYQPARLCSQTSTQSCSRCILPVRHHLTAAAAIVDTSGRAAGRPQCPAAGTKQQQPWLPTACEEHTALDAHGLLRHGWAARLQHHPCRAASFARPDIVVLAAPQSRGSKIPSDFLPTLTRLTRLHLDVEPHVRHGRQHPGCLTNLKHLHLGGFNAHT
jgi:hypothetical protein